MALFKRPCVLKNEGDKTIELEPGEEAEVDFVLIGDEAKVMKIEEVSKVDE